METHLLALPAGYRIESYEIQAVLGKGGFGITYRALDLQLDKHVAIKELLIDSIATRVEGSTVVPQSASLQEDWDWARESFRKEAKVLARFSHPAIVGVHRIIEANGTGYMVMDYVEGETYEARLRRIGRDPDQASLMAVIGPLLDGLREVHEHGLLHRDIKPENILINRRGQPVLIDFGTARSTVAATMTMTMMGTAGYMPIEQSQTKGKKGAWTDIYAIGVMMCRAITGEKPPSATDRIMEDEFQWLSYRQIPGYSEQFLQAVDWALRVRPEERPQSIAGWMPHLLSAGSATSSPPPTPVEESIPETFAPEDPPPEIHSTQEPSSIVEQPPPPKRKYQSVMLAGVVVFVLGCILAPVVVNIIQKSDSEKQAAAAQAVKNATKESPFENSLGMKFVPVSGTNVLFSVWDTRVKDFRAYANAIGYRQQGGIFVFNGTKREFDEGASWEKPGFEQTDFHPVVGVCWDEAKAFCKWLTAKERGEGMISKDQEYRLPTDAEWSVAVGSGKYPWGNEMPPPKGAGNYSPSLGVDSYVNTSPCGNLSTNQFGLYDMGGNVWQWCEDWYRASMHESAMLEKYPGLKDDGEKYRVVRGSSWDSYGPENLLSSFRSNGETNSRNSLYGFRCVLGASR